MCSYSIWHFAALEAEVRRSMRPSHFLARSLSAIKAESFRIFISTWNVGGYTPTAELDLDDFIPADDHSDIYVLGTCRDCPQDGNFAEAARIKAGKEKIRIMQLYSARYATASLLPSLHMFWWEQNRDTVQAHYL